MKRKNIAALLILILVLGLFVGYRFLDMIRTDNTPPQITIQENEEQILQISVQDPESVLLQGVTATDNRDGDVTGSVIVESKANVEADGRMTVTYAAFDRSGNVAKAQRQVQYADYVGPRFTLEKPLLFASTGRMDMLENIGAVDGTDGDISHRIKVTMMDNSAMVNEGIHWVMFRVTNSLTDTRELTLPVEVYYAGKYNAQLSLKEYLVYLPVGGEFHSRDYLDSILVMGETTPLTGEAMSNCRVQISGVVDTQTPGVYAVNYTVTQSMNGNSYTGYSKLIVVVEE